MKPISENIRNTIISHLDAGQSLRQIAVQLGISHVTVSRVRTATRPGIKKGQGGRPAKLTQTNKRMMARMIVSGKADNAAQLKQKLIGITAVDVSTETVRRALKGAGLKAVTKKKKPRLLPRHKQQRLDFALRHKDWTVEDWKRVIWSDETKINRLGSDGRIWAWKKPGSGFTDQHVKGTLKFGGGSLMLWGCMTAQGVGCACRIDGRMDSTLYVSILNDELMQTLEYYGLDRGNVVFQQDNDPKHVSKVARQWFQNNKIEVLDWPSQSPDLNPIEHLWHYLKKQLATYDTEPKGVHELWERVEAEWEKIPRQVCLGLIESMPKRVAAVVAAKGGHTAY